ncbi:MAG: acetoacetyl-CoA reductase [Proteobacteria bacterium]|nr:MAG: acetoacetyl-CoA reductase [Pseudomonadota bacterium]
MSNKTALVTGGTGGLGTAICKALADRGDLVIACYLPQEVEQARDWQAKLKEEGYEIRIVAGDVSSFDDTRRMIGEIESNYGWVDILVNCAGITRDKTLRKMDESDWESVVSVNLGGVFNVTRQVIEGMIERGFGRIVNISSVNGQKGQFGQTNYSAAKAGMHGFTMALAQEAARKGVTVNSVSPGYIATAMTEAIPEEVRNQIVAGIPVGRMGDPEDIAHTIAFLTDEKSDYITGANIPVNGGLFMSF